MIKFYVDYHRFLDLASNAHLESAYSYSRSLASSLAFFLVEWLFDVWLEIKMKQTFTFAVIAVSSLAACTASQDATAPNIPFAGLQGTSWQLVEFQSMDDGQGSKRPDDPGKYTLTFGKDGLLSAKLDCNRGVGNWRNDISNATGGTLAFGPMAITKALCPEPTMSDLLERQLPYVRSFIIRDGHLHMALMADGGIIVWEPARAPR